MKTPTEALIWRQWRMTRYAALGVSAGAVAIITLDVLLHAIHLITEEELALGSFGVAIGTVCFALYTLFQGSDINNLTPSFPASLYGLPVRSTKLAVIELGGRSLAILFVFLTTFLALAAAHWLTLSQDRAPIHPEDLVQFANVLFGCVAVYSAIQAICWCPFGVQALLCAITAVLFVGPVRSVALSFLELLPRVEIFPLAAGILLCSYGVAIWAVRFGRGGVPSSGISDFSLPFRRNQSPFRSPLSAQCWMEWRAFGNLVPSLALLLTSAVAICVHQAFAHLGTPTHGNEPQGLGFAVAALTTVFSPILLSVSAAVAGTLLFVRDWKERGGVLSFVLVRPMPTSALVSARLRTGMVSIMGGILVLSALLCSLQLAAGTFHTTTLLREVLGVEASSSLTFAILTHVALTVFVAWVLLWLGAPVIATLILVVYPLAILAQLALTMGAPEDTIVAILGLLCPTLTAGVVLGCALSARKGVRSKVVSARSVAMAVFIWAAVGVFLLSYAKSKGILPSVGDPAPSVRTFLLEQSVIWGLAFLAALPMVSVPLTLHRLRHR